MTGALLSDVLAVLSGAKWRYGGTTAPPVADKQVSAGIRGADFGMRESFSASSPITGEILWRS